MAEKTNKGLVEYAKKQLGNPYWYGTFGQIGTESLLNYKSAQYKGYYGSSRVAYAKKHHIGKRVHDCVGLMKGYIWSDTPLSVPKYNSHQDKSANGTYNAAVEKGDISTIPEIEGICVHKEGHVGIYIGNGYVIEARGFDYGVVKTKLKDRPWQHWFKNPYIKYVETPTIKYFPKYDGASGSIVDALRSLNIDSSFKNRSKIAKKNCINLYTGTAKQNITLLNLLKNGKLIQP